MALADGGRRDFMVRIGNSVHEALSAESLRCDSA